MKQAVLGSINDTCIMIRILILKSIKYQVSWYIFGTVSVSVSQVHFRCISIINHWYMTVIHLLEFRTIYWRGLQLVSCTHHPECPQQYEWNSDSSPCSLQTPEVEDDFFDYGTINWVSSQCCRQGMYQLLEWHWHSTENAGKTQSNPESFHQI